MAADSYPPQLSIVIPAYNEAARIRPTLEEYASHFTGRYGDGFEIVVVLNGCTDDTRAVVENVTQHSPQVRLIEFATPLGKGGAVWEGFAAARGARLAFADADNMVRAPETQRLISALDDYELAIGDRFGGGSSGGGRPLSRQLASKAMRTWVRFFLGLRFQDTQCGAKAVRASAWQTLAPHVREKGWAFDLDLLANAKRLGFSVAEVPVAWKHVEEGSKLRTWQAGAEALLATLRIRRRQRRGP